MPDLPFRGDPYAVLGVPAEASSSTIKQRWRELAREHHPDRAAADREAAARLNSQMARINAAYDLLRDPVRRARYDASAAGRRSRARAAAADEAGIHFDAYPDTGPGDVRHGPPPPPRTPPVTARFDTSAAFRPRNTTLEGRAYRPAGRTPVPRPAPRPDELRASTPSGPVERQPGRRRSMPSLREALETEIEFGKFRGYTLGEVALLEPTYVDWLSQTITRDDDLVRKARVVRADLDRQGIVRKGRPSSPGWGSRAAG